MKTQESKQSQSTSHRPDDPIPFLESDLKYPDTARQLLDDAVFDPSEDEWVIRRPTGDLRVSIDDMSRIRRTYRTLHLA